MCSVWLIVGLPHPRIKFAGAHVYTCNHGQKQLTAETLPEKDLFL